MSTFNNLRSRFDINWTTVLAGWKGLGAFSPWPDRADVFPPLLSLEEINGYATERLASVLDVGMQDRVIELLSLDSHTVTRWEVECLLTTLAALDGGELGIEQRKWRCTLLQLLLDNLPHDTIDALMALTDFWQGFGLPPEMPHEVQGIGSSETPSSYYDTSNLERLLRKHREWLSYEIIALKGKAAVS